MLNTASPHSAPKKKNGKTSLKQIPKINKANKKPHQNLSKAVFRSEELGCVAPFSANIISKTCNLQILKARTFYMGVAVPVTTAGCGTDGSWLIARKPLAVSTTIIIETEASRHPERSQESCQWDCLVELGVFVASACRLNSYKLQCFYRFNWELK